jgi:hypothetical protein
MDNIGKWLWILGLALGLVWGLATAFGMALPDILVSVVVLAAFLGGILHLSKGDRTAYFIATAALWAVAFTPWVMFGLEAYVAPIFQGAATAALAGAAGVLVMTIYEWVKP